MAPRPARLARVLSVSLLAGVACLAAVPDAHSAPRLTKATKLRLPSEGNVIVARLELRATPATIRRRGRIATPRLQVRRAGRLARDIGVFAGVRRAARRGRFTAFVVAVNPVQRPRSSVLRSLASQDAFFEVALRRSGVEEMTFELNAASSKAFPNVLNANSPRAEQLASQLFPPALARCKPIRRSRTELGPCRLQFFGAVAAAQDRPIDEALYRIIRASDPIRRTDVQTFRFPPQPGEGSRSGVSFLFSQPVAGVRIESLDGRRIVDLGGASPGLRCERDATVGFCIPSSPGTGGSFVIGQTPGVPPGTAGIELTPVLPPFQPVAPPVDNRVVM